MLDPIEPSTVYRETDELSDSVETHPAYGQIGASRWTGKTFLYGTDFEHHNFVVITIGHSEMHRGLSHDHPMDGNRQLIQVALSEAQWATFVSTLNIGMGVPCTLMHTAEDGEIPGIIPVVNRREQFTGEVNRDLREAEDFIDQARALLKDKGSKASKSELESLLVRAKNRMTGGVGFVAKAFDEHVVRVTEQAKIEVNAHIQNVLTRTGIKALQDGPPPVKLLDEKTERRAASVIP